MHQLIRAGHWTAWRRPPAPACLAPLAILPDPPSPRLTFAPPLQISGRVVSQCTAGLPDDKPRYVMGIGYPLDIVICSGKV